MGNAISSIVANSIFSRFSSWAQSKGMKNS
jgi:hypothetical protein